MTPNHKPYLDWMQTALDGSLDSDQRAQLNEHLATCRACATHWAALLAAERLLDSAPLAAPRTGFTSRFKARLVQRRSQPKTLIGALTLGFGAVGAAALIIPVGASFLLSGFQMAQEPAATLALSSGANAVTDFIAVFAEAFLIAARAVFAWAIGNPLVWAASVSGLAITAMWLYFVRKLIPEVSFR
jgi:anti-sigma factor RsiW